MTTLKRGTFAVGAPTDAVQQLTGRAPEDMETIARRYLHTMAGTTRGPAGMARAMTVITKLALTSGPRLSRYFDAYQDGTEFGNLAADSEHWYATHDPNPPLHSAPPVHTPTAVTASATNASEGAAQ